MTEEKDLETAIGFKVIFKKEVSDKILWLTQNYEKEISGWLTGEMKGSYVYVDNILFPHQEVGGASVDTDGKNLIDLRKEYGDECLRIIGHWHSHNTMSAYWSSTDDDFMKIYVQPRDFGLFVVSAVDEPFRIKLIFMKPLMFSFDNVPYTTFFTNDTLAKELESMIKEKIVEVKFMQTEKSEEAINNSGNNLFNIEREVSKRVFINKKNNILYVRDLTPEMMDLFDNFINKIVKKKNMSEINYQNGTKTLVISCKNKRNSRILRDDAREILTRFFEEQDDVMNSIMEGENVDTGNQAYLDENYNYNNQREASGYPVWDHP
ncbi:hypothetical protein LCGC14_0556250 [marine sediment metagenome]|uniref:JAB domain-containing protein n=1 Tax=marine sediment metagenome TaxID=412755 RepID=A0A0F9S6R8_9ZZZZ